MPFWQVPPVTAFADLPDYWSCPQCGAPKAGFLLLDEPVPAEETADRSARPWTSMIRSRFARSNDFGYTPRHPFPTLDSPPRV
ncbi:rubredoxin [Methylomonas sp. MS20]